jgi:hypothetical protein
MYFSENLVYSNPMTRLLASFVLAVALTGCGTATVQHPGAINTFDSNSYDALLTAQGALDQARTQYAALTDAQKRTVGPVFNKVIAAFTAAQDAYKAYHGAAAGAPDQTALQLQINQVIADIAALVRQIGTPQ